MDQIRAKLERAQLRLARSNAAASAQMPNSALSSRYIPSSEYASLAHKPPIRSVKMEDMPATVASNCYPPSTYAPPPSTRRQPPPSAIKSKSHHSRAPSTKQYQSRSKYASYGQEDPLNGGPPPMSTPYLVYSNSAPVSYIPSRRGVPSSQYQHHPMDKYSSNIRAAGDKSMAPPPSTVRDRGLVPRVEKTTAPPPSMMTTSRHATAPPPSSRVRFEADAPKAKSKEPEHEPEKPRRDAKQEPSNQEQQERRRHRLFRRQEAQSNIKDGKSPTTTQTDANGVEAGRPRRNSLVANPPKSAIKISAFTEGIGNIPGSPLAHPRRGSAAAAPPKSDIKIEAFDFALPARRSSAPEPPVSVKKDQEADNLFSDPVPPFNEPEGVEQPLESSTKEAFQDSDKLEDKLPEHSDAESETQTEGSEDHFVLVTDNRLLSARKDMSTLAAALSDHEDDQVEETDSEVPDFSDFDVESARTNNQLSESDMLSDSDDDADDVADIQDGEKSPASNQEVVNEAHAPIPEEESSPAPSTKLTPHQIALQALGRDINMSETNSGSRGSLRLSSIGKARTSPARTSLHLPTAAAAAPSTAISRSYAVPPAAPATTTPAPGTAVPRGPTVSRPKASGVIPPAPQTAGYIRRSRARQPLDLKHQLPPPIGALSGLSDGPTTFTLDESAFYEVEWKTGEFGFSLQRVYYCDRNYRDGTESQRLFLRMLLNTDRSICKSFRNVRVGDILIRIGSNYVSDLGLEGSASVLSKFFERLQAQTPIRLTFQRMHPSEWEGGVEL